MGNLCEIVVELWVIMGNYRVIMGNYGGIMNLGCHFFCC